MIGIFADCCDCIFSHAFEDFTPAEYERVVFVTEFGAWFGAA